MRRTSARRFVVAALAAIAFGAALAGTIGLAAAWNVENMLRPALIAAGLLIAVVALWTLHDVLADHFRMLERLRALAIAMRAADVSTGLPLDEADAETAALAGEILAFGAARVRERSAPDDRLSAVLSAVGEAIIALTNEGQVTLVNGPAKAMMGAEHIAVGTSIYDVLLRESLVGAMARARAAAAPVAARLETVGGTMLDATVADMGRFRGAVICIPSTAASSGHVLEHDLSLHDRPPPPLPFGDATPLTDLPITVVDTETTGLDTATDRIVALGGIRLHGARLYRSESLDILVNPGRPIAPASIAIHGITDAMVAMAPPWREQVERLQALSAGTLLIGHNIGFDLALLRAETARAGLAWPEPPALDIVQLVAALEPAETAFDLEDVAARHGVAVQGRHTALGDCLTAAALWQRLMPRLESRGILTLGDARNFAATARRIIARQHAAGW